MEHEVLSSGPQEYLDICERSLRKYITLHGDSFDVDQAIKMLECNVICKNNLANRIHGDMICFLCASICIDCLDPLASASGEEVSRKYERIHQFLKASYEQSSGVDFYEQ